MITTERHYVLHRRYMKDLLSAIGVFLVFVILSVCLFINGLKGSSIVIFSLIVIAGTMETSNRLYNAYRYRRQWKRELDWIKRTHSNT